MSDKPHEGRALRALIGAAAFVVVVAGLRAATDILLPVLFSTFLAMLAIPPLTFLRRLGVPRWASIALVVLVIAAFLAGVTGILAETVRAFTARIGQYETDFAALTRRTVDYASMWGVDLTSMDLTEANAGVMMQLVGQSLNALVGVLGRGVIVIITLTFMLFEASEWSRKVEVAFGTHERPFGPFTDTTIQIQRYLVIKTIASVITGLLAAAGAAAFGVDFPILWGLIAFLLNYIPTIGSFIAAVPPVALALVQAGPGWAIGLAIWFLVINTMIGSLLEPRFQGRSLGLSPMVVFLSLLFWGWLWGPVGALFSVPMTVIAKLVLESNDDTRWIAVFLGSPRDVEEIDAAHGV